MTASLIWAGGLRSFEDPPAGFYVAAPVRIHRVVVETSGESTIDPFKRAIVNLVVAGVNSKSAISAILGIADSRFVDEVVRQVVEDDRLLVVRRGQLTLTAKAGGDLHGREGFGASGRQRKIWLMVQDLQTGRLWPRAVRRLEYPEVDDEARVAHLGNPGRPVRRKYWRITSDPDVCPPPTDAEVKAELNQHLKDVAIVRLPAAARVHLADLGKPGLHRPAFSVRLQHSTSSRLLAPIVDATAAGKLLDPFGVGTSNALREWTRAIVDSAHVANAIETWTKRRKSDHVGGDAEGTMDAIDEVDVVALADVFRSVVDGRDAWQLGLSSHEEADRRLLIRRWRELGFNAPSSPPRVIPALVECAVAGVPVEILDLFYAWSLLATSDEARDLSSRFPDLPDLIAQGVPIRGSSDGTSTQTHTRTASGI